jgi:ATP-dependent RNA helicase DDX31/DBP7
MADDGLLLNFSVPDTLFAPKAVYRGGSWRTRNRVQKIDQLRSQGIDPTSAKPLSGANAQGVDEERLPKRQKLNSSQISKASRPTAPVSQALKALREERSSDGPRQVISSLFTSNPSSRTAIETESKSLDPNPVEPSNAPLTKEQLNFTTLGLTPSIAAHLTNRLAISAPTAIQKVAIPALLKDNTDAFIQAETGSGKTLAYLLPIVQRIMQLSAESQDKENGVQRNSGLFALIMVPTRELSKQIFAVLELLLMGAHWIVAGSVMGGEKKKSEKARLRKGLNILVATPGRLADHIQHTEALDVSSVRWLVLDEGDRLMELGFEEDIKRIVSQLDYRMKHAKGKVHDALPKKRINILCSATMKMDVQRLGEISLNEAVHVTADPAEAEAEEAADFGKVAQKQFSVPTQLKQSYLVVPAKLRLVSLIATLKKSFARCAATTKILVFMSCADSVDFHFRVITREDEEQKEENASDDSETDLDDGKSTENPNHMTVAPRISKRDQAKFKKETLSFDSGTLADSPILTSPANKVTAFRLHGSLPQAVRTSTLKSFSECSTPAVLICTDIASRGLDLSHVDRIIEFDPAFSREEHLHRVGRTARAGKEGAAAVFLMPGCEEAYVEVLKSERADTAIGGLRRLTADDVLKAGFDNISSASTADTTAISKGSRKRGAPDQLSASEQLATEYQLLIERWVLDHPPVLEAARRAFQSHVRAYATHVKEERVWFDIKELHLGHLAKAFGLRDRPGNVHVPGMRASTGKVKADRRKAGGGAHVSKTKRVDAKVDAGAEVDLTEARMMMRRKAQKAAGAGEFNLA